MAQRHKLTIALLMLTLVVPSVAAAAPRQAAGQRTERLAGVTADEGGMVKLVLHDHSSIAVPFEMVVLTDTRREGEMSQFRVRARAGSADGSERRRARLNLQQHIASTVTVPVPAAVKLRYGADGKVRRARIIVFPSDAEADAFLRRANDVRGDSGASTQ